MRDILLMTATIAPKAEALGLAHVDVAKRLAEYAAALRFYLGELRAGTFDRLVLADNSGHPLDSLAAIVAEAGLGDRVDLLSVPVEREPDRGRFFLELGLLNAALACAPLAGLAAEDRIWKVSGRYMVLNVAAIVRTAPKAFDLYVNSRNRPLRWTDFYLAAFTKAGFRAFFVDRDAYCEERVPGEMILRARIDDPAFTRLAVAPRMRRVPRVSGVRGWDGRRYDDWRSTIKYYARAGADRLLPRLWI